MSEKRKAGQKYTSKGTKISGSVLDNYALGRPWLFFLFVELPRIQCTTSNQHMLCYQSKVSNMRSTSLSHCLIEPSAYLKIFEGFGFFATRLDYTFSLHIFCCLQHAYTIGRT